LLERGWVRKGIEEKNQAKNNETINFVFFHEELLLNKFKKNVIDC